MKINVAVFFGCVSVEHEVSIISGVQAMSNMNKEKYNILPVYVSKDGEMYTGDPVFDIQNFKDIPLLLKSCTPVTLIRKNDSVVLQELNGLFKRRETVVDIAFPVVHGTNCEDGTLAGLFEFLGLPYVGCNIISSALGMDKAVCKYVLKNAGIPVLDCVTLRSRDYLLNRKEKEQEITQKIGFPLIIKPVNLGSSVGISKVKNSEELRKSLELAFSFADEILAEHAIENLKEVNCSVLGDYDNCRTSVLEAPVSHDEILSYEDKYIGKNRGSKSEASKGMASLSRKIPADISDDQTAEIKEIAVRAFKALDCSGVVRIDFMIDRDDNKIYLNEFNTIPGSLAFYLWEASGVKYCDMIDELIDIAYRKKRAKNDLMFTIDTNILSGVKSFGAKGSKGGKL